MILQGRLAVISGFSGTGKGTLVKRLMEEYDNYCLSVSRTTRMPRAGEKDGVHYIFSTDEEFQQMIREDGFVEYAGYVGNYYGTPRAFVEENLARGKDVLLEIEMQGALKVKERYPQALLIFVLPPSFRELKRRLVNRGTETAEVIEQRMARAREEIKYMEYYDYYLVNDDLEECVQKLHKRIQKGDLSC